MPEIANTTTAATTATPSTATTATSNDTVKALELSHSFTDFEDKERSATYHFRRPTRPQISRSQSAMRKDAMAALRTLCLDCVVAEEKDKLKADLEEYEGLAGTFGNEILGRVGFGELGK